VDDDLVIRPGVIIPARDLQWRFSRASGPGGQGVNTTDSRVQLVFDLAKSSCLPDHLRQRALERLARVLVDGCIVVTAQTQRSQLLNREDARRRLVDILRRAISPPPLARRPTGPSRSAVDKRIKEKKARGETKRLRRDLD
jgi:ribosome-associated protein